MFSLLAHSPQYFNQKTLCLLFCCILCFTKLTFELFSFFYLLLFWLAFECVLRLTYVIKYVKRMSKVSLTNLTLNRLWNCSCLRLWIEKLHKLGQTVWNSHMCLHFSPKWQWIFITDIFPGEIFLFKKHTHFFMSTTCWIIN